MNIRDPCFNVSIIKTLSILSSLFENRCVNTHTHTSEWMSSIRLLNYVRILSLISIGCFWFIQSVIGGTSTELEWQFFVRKCAKHKTIHLFICVWDSLPLWLYLTWCRCSVFSSKMNWNLHQWTPSKCNTVKVTSQWRFASSCR